MIDIGANLTHESFRDDFDAVISRALAADVTTIVVTGTSVAASEAAVALCAHHPAHLFCTVGVHPHEAGAIGGDWLDALRRLARSPYVRAIGETGLDFNRNYSPHPDQHHVFDAQLALAGALQLPVYVHDRDTDGAVAQHVAAHRSALRDVVIHCFTGSAIDLERYLALDCHIGITGWICDERRGGTLRDVVAMIPDDRLLIETDAPYLLPRTMTPRPRSRRNEPAHLIWVARAIAQARSQSVEHVAAIATANARRVFALD